MKDGFIRVAAATPDIKVADPVYNEAQIWNMIEEGEKNGVKLMVFPELCLTGYTCGDLFLQDIMVDTAADMEWDGRIVPFGSGILLRCVNLPELVVAGEICEDVWVMDPPSISHARAGATVIVNCSASSETAGKHTYRRSLIAGQSARLVCGYICANAGEGESTQDLVFGGHDLIAENGTLLVQSSRFSSGIVYADLDVLRIVNERRRMGTFGQKPEKEYRVVPFP